MFPVLKFISLVRGQRYFIKYGSRVRLTEAVTNEFIAKHTTIPVPRFVDVFKYNGTVHMVQEFIDAPLLWQVWPKLGLNDRKRCMDQLKGYLEQLRSLVPPEPGKVQSTGKALPTTDLATTNGDHSKVMMHSMPFSYMNDSANFLPATLALKHR
jgi:hypothetical protein